jgi:hypothetical protein
MLHIKIIGSAHETSKDTACTKRKASLCGTAFEIYSNPCGSKRVFSYTKSSLTLGPHPASFPGGVVGLFPEGYSNRCVRQLLTSMYCHDLGSVELYHQSHASSWRRQRQIFLFTVLLKGWILSCFRIKTLHRHSTLHNKASIHNVSL